MDRTGAYRKAKTKEEPYRSLSLKNLLVHINYKLAMSLLIGFFISRVSVLNMMNPSSIAYLSLFSFTGSSYYGILVSVLLGLVSSQTDLLKYMLAFAIITAINFFIGEKKDKLMLQAVMGTVVTFTAGIVKALALGISLYFIMMAILEAALVFAFVFLFHKAVRRIQQVTIEKYFTNDELISIAILAAATVIGISNIEIANVHIVYIFVFLIVMVIGYRGGAVLGGSFGLILGLLLLLTNNINTEQIVLIASAGLLCGFVHGLGKITTAAAFILDLVVLSLYLHNNISDTQLYIEACLAAVLFIIIPKKVYEQIKTVLSFDQKVEDKAYVLKIQEVAVENLKAFSRAFSKLSDTFSNISEKRRNLSQKEIAKLFDDVATKVCSECGMKTYCWENYFYNTYQTMFSILAAAEKKGHIDENDIPFDFKNKCVKLPQFVDTTNRMFEIYKNNLMWNNRIIETRKLISEQLESVATVINNLSNDMKLELNFNEDLEKTIRLALSGYGVERVMVIEDKYGKYEVTLSIKPCYGRKVCAKEIIPIISKILDRNMKSQDLGCNISKEEKLCNLKLVEEQKYKVVHGVARAVKNSSHVSGDNYSFMEIRNDQCLMALSDGMGSGSRANRESAASIELLEEFLESGFDKDVAIKMINSALVLKSAEESFSTIDMCIIDMHEAIAEFVKIGAAATYIKRGNDIQVISSTSLPAGILSNVDMEMTKKRLKDGDIIVMVTDGVLDSSDEIIKHNDQWLEKALQDIKSNNPQDIADYILQRAKDNAKGDIQDDMTVLVSKFWEKY